MYYGLQHLNRRSSEFPFTELVEARRDLFARRAEEILFGLMQSEHLMVELCHFF